jgi:Protein of unknown function (DUF3102)
MQNLEPYPQLLPVSKYQRSLEDIKMLICKEYQQQQEAIRQSLIHAKVMGDLLLEAKIQLRHGQWANWLKENFPFFAETTVRNYMRISQNWNSLKETATIADLTVVNALKHLSKKQRNDKLSQAYPTPTEDLLSFLTDVELRLKHFKTINWKLAVSERIFPVLDKLAKTEKQLSNLKLTIDQCSRS